jgi:hypothetical protein
VDEKHLHPLRSVLAALASTDQHSESVMSLTWRLYQSTGFFANLITCSAALLERCSQNEQADDTLQEVKELLHSGIEEARTLMPLLMTYANSVFEETDQGVYDLGTHQTGTVQLQTVHSAKQVASLRHPSSR